MKAIVELTDALSDQELEEVEESQDMPPYCGFIDEGDADNDDASEREAQGFDVPDEFIS